MPASLPCIEVEPIKTDARGKELPRGKCVDNVPAQLG
jgi:hypothetical protein